MGQVGRCVGVVVSLVLLTHCGWVRQEGSPGEEWLDALVTDAEGGFVTVSSSEGLTLSRSTAEGRLLWTREVATGGVWATGLAVTASDDVLVVGNYEGSPDLGTGPLPAVPDGRDDAPGLFLARLSPEGQPLWVRGFAPYNDAGEPQPSYPAEVATDAEGSLFLVGGFEGRLDLGGGTLDPRGQGPEDGSPSTSGFLAKFSRDGQHLWSRAFGTGWHFAQAMAGTVSTDARGHVLIGGAAGARSDLGAGPLGASGPFIAKYSASGSLLWARVFRGAEGSVEGVRPLDAETVAFSANLWGPFTFGGESWNGTGGFLGTLGAGGADGWVRSLGLARIEPLTVGPEGTLSVTGRAPGPSGWRSFVWSHSREGNPLGSRVLDEDSGWARSGSDLLLLQFRPRG